MIIFFMALLLPPNYTATVLNFFLLIIFFCSLVYSSAVTVGLIAVCSAAILLLPRLNPALSISPPLFLGNVAVYCLMAVVAYIRRLDWLYLHTSESRYRSLMEVSLEIMVVHDGEGRILDVNSGFEKLLGYTRQEIIGMGSIELVAPTDQSRVLKAWRQNVLTPVIMKVITRDKHIRDLEMSFRTLEYQGVPAHLIIGHDITEKNQAETARLENELRYAALFNGTADAVLISSLEGIILSVNQQAAAMLRCGSQELIGRPYRDFIVDATQPDSTTTLHHLKAGAHIPIYERQFRRKDGTLFSGEVNAVLVRDAAGLPLYLQSLIRDISARKQMEDQKFELALQREKLRILQSFIDDVSHYFRTPLTALKTGVYLLPRFAHLPDKQHEQLATMTIQIARLEQLLEDLLMVVRLEQESTDTTRNTRVNINKLLLQLLPRFINETHEHEWKFLPCSDALEVIGDKHRLAHAISNILSNARTYTPVGGKIMVRTLRYDTWAVLEIMDTGIGIAPVDQPRIFDNFYRGDAARTLDSDSSGMGLPISLKIIHLHRGMIRMLSAPGQGTIFQILLPTAGNWTRITPEAVAHSGLPDLSLSTLQVLENVPSGF
jgi:PAS domain S-box-containing protein